MVQRAYAFPFCLLVGRKSFKQMIDSRIIGERLRLIRTRLGMSQKQLAAEIGVSPSRISDYVSGRAEPTLKIARLLCSTLGITPAAMLGY